MHVTRHKRTELRARDSITLQEFVQEFTLPTWCWFLLLLAAVIT